MERWSTCAKLSKCEIWSPVITCMTAFHELKYTALVGYCISEWTMHVFSMIWDNQSSWEGVKSLRKDYFLTVWGSKKGKDSYLHICSSDSFGPCTSSIPCTSGLRASVPHFWRDTKIRSYHWHVRKIRVTTKFNVVLCNDTMENE